MTRISKLAATMSTIALGSAAHAGNDDNHLKHLQVSAQMDAETEQQYLDHGISHRKHGDFLPFFGDVLAKRGVQLPRPYGVQVLYSNNNQLEYLSDVAVALTRAPHRRTAPR